MPKFDGASRRIAGLSFGDGRGREFGIYSVRQLRGSDVTTHNHNGFDVAGSGSVHRHGLVYKFFSDLNVKEFYDNRSQQSAVGSCFDLPACRTPSGADAGSCRVISWRPPFTDVSPPCQYISRWGGSGVWGHLPATPLTKVASLLLPGCGLQPATLHLSRCSANLASTWSWRHLNRPGVNATLHPDRMCRRLALVGLQSGQPTSLPNH
uniref:uncharacterized protein LOC131102173 n=1 Tax=Doryrhamphus excisus TaxID=161450 RepID=UPI0025ADF89F|nr:uncharacterized protein LOC131102173 [Doryrhamphus excisus]